VRQKIACNYLSTSVHLYLEKSDKLNDCVSLDILKSLAKFLLPTNLTFPFSLYIAPHHSEIERTILRLMQSHLILITSTIERSHY
jgi:hypothetical protein